MIYRSILLAIWALTSSVDGVKRKKDKKKEKDVPIEQNLAVDPDLAQIQKNIQSFGLDGEKISKDSGPEILKDFYKVNPSHIDEQLSDLPKIFTKDSRATYNAVDQSEKEKMLEMHPYQYYPHGFANYEQFTQFIENFFNTFSNNVRVPIIKIFFVGSAVSTYTAKKKEHFDIGGKYWRFNKTYSDFDILVLPDYTQMNSGKYPNVKPPKYGTKFDYMREYKPEVLIANGHLAKIDTTTKNLWFKEVKNAYTEINSQMSEREFFLVKEPVHFAFYTNENDVKDYYKKSLLLQVKYNEFDGTITTDIWPQNNIRSILKK